MNHNKYPLFFAILLAATVAPVCAQETNPGWRRVDDPPRQPEFVQFPDRAPQAQPPQTQAPQQPNYQLASQRPPVQITIPAGTWLTVRVNQPLSSDRNLPGDSFTATLTQPVVADGFVIARRGQTIGGRVAEAIKAGKVKGTSRLGIELTELSLVDGQQLPIRSQLVETSSGPSKGRDASAIGTTTAVGAAIGAAAGGGFGAGMGAIAGAGASAIGVLVTRGHATEIFPEEQITFRTLAPLTISTERAEQAFQPVGQQDYQSPSGLQQRVSRPATVYGPAPYPYYYGPAYSPYFYGPGFYGPSFSFFYGPRFYGGRGFRRW